MILRSNVKIWVLEGKASFKIKSMFKQYIFKVRDKIEGEKIFCVMFDILREMVIATG